MYVVHVVLAGPNNTDTCRGMSLESALERVALLGRMSDVVSVTITKG